MAPGAMNWPSPPLSLWRLRCSYKTATVFVCTCNTIAALYVLNSLLGHFSLFSAASQSPSLAFVLQSEHSGGLRVVRYSEDQLNRIKKAVEIWKAARPVDLIRRVKEIKEDSAAGFYKLRQSESTSEKVASDLAKRLKELRGAGNQNDQQALEEWRKKKLEEARKREIANKGTLEDSSAMEEAQAVGMS